MPEWIRITAVMVLTLFLVQTVAGAIPLQDDKIVIAIVDFNNTSNDESLNYLEKGIPESLITHMARSGRLEIVERGRLQDAISEMQLGMTGIVDEQTAVEVGRAVGANAILVGSFVTIGEMIQINARLIDVETSKIIKADSRRGRVGEEIFDLMDQMASSMEIQMMGTEGKQVAVQQVPRKSMEIAGMSEKQPVYTKWWFWAVVGAGAAGGLYLASGSGNGQGSTSSAVTISVPIP